MLSKFSVNKPYTVVVAVVCVIILGFVAFGNMTTDLLPEIDLPYTVVMTTDPGASPEEVETEVTKILESALASTSDLENIESISMSNTSLILMEFSNEANLDSVNMEISEKLNMVSPSLDKDTIGTPMVMQMNPNMIPLMVSAVTFDRKDTAEVTEFVNNDILSDLKSTSGVAAVNTIGGGENSINITITESKLKELNKKIYTAIDDEIGDAVALLNKAEANLNTSRAELDSTIAGQGKKLSTSLNEAIAGLEEINTQSAALDEQIDEAEANDKSLKEAISKLNAEIEATDDEAAKTALQSQVDKLTAQESEVTAGLNQLHSAKKTLDNKKAEVEKGIDKLNAAKGELNSQSSAAKSQIDSAKKEISTKRSTLNKQSSDAKASASVDKLITADMIIGILAAQNFSMPAGSLIDDKDNTLTVTVGNKITTLKELENLYLLDMDMKGVDPITLGDAAKIEFAKTDLATYAKINGEDGIILSFEKQSSYSTANVCDNINEAFADLEKEYEGLHFTNLMDQGEYINLVTSSVMENLIFGAILAIIILFLFLHDLRPTLIVAISIPASVLFAIVLMYFSGVTLNIISLSGLALGVGMLVDNSIVAIENIYRLKNLGMSAKDASIQGAKQISGAIVASTLTTICVFVPILFTKGMAKDLFLDMGLTVAYSLLASLLVALTVVPALSSGALKRMQKEEGRVLAAMKGGYKTALGWALNHRLICILAALILFIGSMVGAFTAGTSFMPDADSYEMTATITMNDEDATDEELYKLTDKATERILAIEGVNTVGAIESGSESMFSMMGDSSGMSLYLILDEDKKLSNAEIAQKIQEATKDLDCMVTTSTSSMDISALGGSGITIELQGDDSTTLANIVLDLEKQLQDIDGIAEITDVLGEGAEELNINVNKTKAMKNNLTVAQVYKAVSKALAEDSSATTVNIEGTDYSVIVADGTKNEITRNNIKNLVLVEENKDKNVKEVLLKDVATISNQVAPATIYHYNQKGYSSISIEVKDGASVTAVDKEVQKVIKKYDPPQGYTISTSGESDTINDLISDLLKAIGAAILLIYLIMVAQFQSFLSPFIVIFSVPLAFTGGFLALLITGFDVSVIALLGCLVLTGIIVNNGIVLIDYINQLRKNSEIPKREALLEAGATRMRPILMTACTTILAMSTLALGIGTGSEMIQPMAIVSIGGLIYATVTTLFIIPIIYDLFHKDKKIRRSSKRDSSLEPTTDHPTE